MAKQPMTEREIFERVRAHLLAQGGKAQNERGDLCVYRASDGKKCAAGCLIDDEHYTPALEGGVVVLTEPSPTASRNPSIAVCAALEASGVPRSAFPLVRQLQWIHDDAPVEAWPKCLDIIAAAHGWLPAEGEGQ